MDLPWNPQRIEQRIGRCHRYGQKHDVVVVNFLNRKNGADQRVYQLLSEKFKLFEGVFGASDEVLGAIESGVDFKKRISAIYQQCRHTNEIKTAFDQLQLELSLEINEEMSQTRQKLLENFDYSNHSGKVSALEPLQGQAGWLAVSIFTIEALDQAEDHLLLSGQCDSDEPPSDDAARRLLTLPAHVGTGASLPSETFDRLNGSFHQQQQGIQRTISERNARFFEAEADTR